MSQWPARVESDASCIMQHQIRSEYMSLRQWRVFKVKLTPNLASNYLTQYFFQPH